MKKTLKSIDIRVDSSDIEVILKKKNGYSTVTINYTVNDSAGSANQIDILDPREIIINE